jgi:hypothetical protein
MHMAQRWQTGVSWRIREAGGCASTGASSRACAQCRPALTHSAALNQCVEARLRRNRLLPHDALALQLSQAASPFSTVLTYPQKWQLPYDGPSRRTHIATHRLGQTFIHFDCRLNVQSCARRCPCPLSRSTRRSSTQVRCCRLARLLIQTSTRGMRMPS